MTRVQGLCYSTPAGSGHMNNSLQAWVVATVQDGETPGAALIREHYQQFPDREHVNPRRIETL